MAVCNLFVKGGGAKNSEAATTTLQMLLHPLSHLAQWASSYYRDVLKPTVDLTKAATLTTVVGTLAYKSHATAMNVFINEILGVVSRLSLMLNKYDSPSRNELSESDQGFLLLWSRQLRHYQEIAPEAYRHMLGDILGALEDERLAPGQKLSAIPISLRSIR